MVGSGSPSATRSPLVPVVDAVRLRIGVYRYALRVLDALGHPPLMDPARQAGVRTLAVGLDPIRVLVFGGGLAIGYGVTTRADALDGPLVGILADRTGRGVVLENRAVQHVEVQRTAASLGAVGTHTFHVAVWCPSFVEGLRHLRLSAWRTELHAMIRALRQEECTPLVLTCMPEPAGLHPAAIVARPWVHRLNRMITQVAAEWDEVVAVETVPFVPAEVGAPIAGPAYFVSVAEQVAPAVLAVLRLPTRTTATR